MDIPGLDILVWDLVFPFLAVFLIVLMPDFLAPSLFRDLRDLVGTDVYPESSPGSEDGWDWAPMGCPQQPWGGVAPSQPPVGGAPVKVTASGLPEVVGGSPESADGLPVPISPRGTSGELSEWRVPEQLYVATAPVLLLAGWVPESILGARH